MDAKFITIEEIKATLDQLRQDPNTQRKFPKELWISIIQLTKIHPIVEVCRLLQIKPIYLKRKIHQYQEPTVQFQEVIMPEVFSASDSVTVEIKSIDGLQAKIQGPSSCLNYLCKLFGR